MHQNQGQHDAAASLCLYFEPKATVLRTWTPQRFLRRIQWWLEQSAKGGLHPADQPVEQLFFNSQYELVLPWNIEDLRQSADHRLIVRRTARRPDQSETFFVEAISAVQQPGSNTVAHIEVTLPAVVHGFIERDPPTLGALADMLGKREVDLVGQLRTVFQARVDTSGATAKADDAFTTVLLHIPIARSKGADPERFVRKAFLMLTGPLKLGETMGAYIFHLGKYFNESAIGILGGETPTKWRDEPVFPMEVLVRNSPAVARAQSGIDDEGPDAVLVGAGSLGSTLLNLWGRSGWGRWTVIDKDHIKPHNLSRHTALGSQVGEPKVNVVAALHAAVMCGASVVTGINADACDMGDAQVSGPLRKGSLIIDASTTLEFPRLASVQQDLGRHMSVFLTPNGDSAVLLAEDDKRDKRLRTLEAQYYRALINEDWGKEHLDGNMRTFWSGARCRDISMVLPYSRIVGHAGTLSEQVRFASQKPEASIRIWHRKPETGAVSVYSIPVAVERRFALGDFELFLDDGVDTKLREMRIKGLPNETGGVLLGYYDFNVNSVVVVDALPAPPDSKALPGSFDRGIAGLKDSVTEAARRTAYVVGYIGEWHSHPPGYSADQSGHDLHQLIVLALGMADDGLPAVQLIVGENDIRIFQRAAVK